MQQWQVSVPAWQPRRPSPLARRGDGVLQRLAAGRQGHADSCLHRWLASVPEDLGRQACAVGRQQQWQPSGPAAANHRRAQQPPQPLCNVGQRSARRGRRYAAAIRGGERLAARGLLKQMHEANGEVLGVQLLTVFAATATARTRNCRLSRSRRAPSAAANCAAVHIANAEWMDLIRSSAQAWHGWSLAQSSIMFLRRKPAAHRHAQPGGPLLHAAYPRCTHA